MRIDRITPEELKRKLDAGEEVVIVDLRGSLDFEAEPAMIPGAVHLDYADLEEVSDELAKAAEVVLYCNCPNEVTSAKMALMLRRKGVQKIRPLQNGLTGWRDLGYPVSESQEPVAEKRLVRHWLAQTFLFRSANLGCAMWDGLWLAPRRPELKGLRQRGFLFSHRARTSTSGE